MLLHQRVDFTVLQPPAKDIYLRIPMSSTLWTVIENRRDSSDVKSLAFPSRIIQPDQELSAVFTGVDTSGLLRGEFGTESRLVWKIVPDPEDTDPKQLVVLPLNRNVLFTFSHGSSSLLSLALGGIDVQLYFDIPTRTLSTSWFTPPFTSSWSLGIPRLFMTRLLRNIWPLSITAPEVRETSSQERSVDSESDKPEGSRRFWPCCPKFF